MQFSIQMFSTEWHLPCKAFHPRATSGDARLEVRVPYKIFNAPDGTNWEVWMVMPTSTERRRSEGFGQSSAASGSSNSTTTGVAERRRADTGPKTVVSPGYENGWLCFESKSGEKRRLVPVPDGWETAPAEKLWMWCRLAAEVPRCNPS